MTPGSDVVAATAGSPDGVRLEAAPRPVVGRRLLRRLAVAVAGSAVVLAGLVLVPLPGPGWAIVFSGIALLSTEFPWAERLLQAIGQRLAPVTALLRRVPRMARLALVTLGIAGAAASVAVSVVLLSR